GNDTIRYNINANVDIDGGSGNDTVVVLGTELADTFVVTRDGVFGAGVSATFANVEALTVDGLEGDDTFFVLSTRAGMVTTIIGGTGSDTINVGGDVVGEVVTADADMTGSISHGVTSDDPRFNGIFVPGVSATATTSNAAS